MFKNNLHCQLVSKVRIASTTDSYPEGDNTSELGCFDRNVIARKSKPPLYHRVKCRENYTSICERFQGKDPDALFAEYQSRGLAFHEPLEDTDDGLRAFELKDHDGYVLCFAQPI